MVYNPYMIYISELAGSELIDCLRQKDEVTLIRPSGHSDDRISTHADIYMCRINDTIVSAGPDFRCSGYPEDCAYNAACTGRFLIANTEHLDPAVISEARRQGLEILHVKQGYARCNVLPVDETSVITSDRGIYTSVGDRLDVLLISPGSIKLKGFPYGFIGGTAGRIGDTIYFNGDIDAHPDGKAIRTFIEQRGIDIVDFDYPLEDIGSII